MVVVVVVVVVVGVRKVEGVGRRSCRISTVSRGNRC